MSDLGQYPYGILTSVIPSGGWRFPYPEDYAARTERFIRANTWEDLVRRVRIFRIESGIKLGDVEFDVAEFIKSVSPQNNRHKGRVYTPRPEGHESYNPPIDRAKDWLIAMGRKSRRLVIMADATDRTDACERCPHNVGWRTKCKPCNEDVEFRAQNVRQRPKYQADHLLNFCRLHGVLLNAAVFLDQDELPKRHGGAPKECWMPCDS